MMRGIRYLVACTAATGLLAAGAFGISMEMAHASSPVSSCDGTTAATTTQYECTLTGSVSDASAITVGVTDDTSGYTESIYINYQVNCSDSTNGAEQTADAVNEETPVNLNLNLPTSADGTCTVDALVESPAASSSATNCPTPNASPAPTPNPQPSPTASTCPDDFDATLSFTSAATASATATATSTSTTTAPAVNAVTGYGSRCLDDNGNSGANRAKVQIWTCSSTDQAESWKFSNDELTHNGKCLNDKADGGSGTKMILYSCNGASNDKWSHLSNGEYKLKAHNGTLCLNDPRSSTKNGTQLIVYNCTDSANEKWSMP
jgi:beta-glucosidase